MHPILARNRIGFYLAAWLPVAALLGLALGRSQPRSTAEAVLLAVPLSLAAAFLGPGSWWVCRALPLGRTPVWRLAAGHAASVVVSCALWLLSGEVGSALLSSDARFVDATARFRADVPLLFWIGALVFVVATVVHYLILAFEASRRAERASLELQILARDAQVEALRLQLNPHFLFNSLNSVSALVGRDAEGARRMCLSLAAFLRDSLRLGAERDICLADEIRLAEAYLAIERVRFGDRLSVDVDVDAGAAACRVPSLLLQPLVENAVRHGIASRVDGGSVHLAARRTGDRLEIVVENPYDPDKPPGRPGLGLANAKARLLALHPGAARLDLHAESGRFRITIEMPAVVPEGSGPESEGDA